jgi:hypothetical protein
LEEYTRVPPSDATALVPPSDATALDGTLFVAVEARDGAQSGDCAISATGPGIDVVALDPELGKCVARARILASGPDPYVQVHYSSDATTAVTGTCGGKTQFPVYCTTHQNVLLNSECYIFVARLRLAGGTICTEWVDSASVTGGWYSFGPEVLDVAMANDGSVAAVGVLGTLAYNHYGTDSVPGAFTFASGLSFPAIGTFLATWSPSGALRGVWRSESDVLFAVDEARSSWITTGQAVVADPRRYCAGVSHVTDAPNQCTPESDAGAGGSDGAPIADANIADSTVVDGSSAGTGGLDGGSGDAASALDAAARNTANVFLMITNSEAACTRFESFGSDCSGSAFQAGRGVSMHETGCGADLAGANGIARFLGGASVGCASGGFAWSIRLEGPGSVGVDRIEAGRSSDTTTALAVAQGAQGGSLTLRRCGSDGVCVTDSRSASLATTAPEQLVVLRIGGDGALIWHAAFGPASIGARLARADLALDRRDRAYVAFLATGPLESHNVQSGSCPELTTYTGSGGEWVIALAGDGAADQALCRWARQF